VRLREFLVAIEGLALWRHLFEGDDATAGARIEEVRRIVGDSEAATFDLGLDVPELGVRPGYAAWSKTYDEPGNPLIAIEQPVVHALLDEAAPGRALDAGCGTGRHAAYLARRDHTVVGVDLSPAMLEQAREKLPTVAFLESDLSALPLRSECFDLVVCTLALLHVADLGGAVAELARVTRRGGRLVLSDLHPSTGAAPGGQAFFQTADGGAGFVRQHSYLHGDYLSAFSRTGLEVRRCLEPRFEQKDLEQQGLATRFVPEAAAAAFLGHPSALVWDLVRR
jgi:SAM-dependent methyltransferase